MVSKPKITSDVYHSQQKVLRRERSLASPWPDDAKLGLDDGAGYNFDDISVGDFTNAIYANLRAKAGYEALHDPVDAPRLTFLDETPVFQRRWISADVIRQLGAEP
uniref:hypothetical protein n=1 Tax=uncultured Caulobacter sp. TaxID=158749 RepID=UPI0025F547A6|nr:hypothetical protein [uncultured Caulobacter sp.]